MGTKHEQFWKHKRYAVVGHSEKRPFPRLTYNGLKQKGKQVFAVDPSAKTVEGDKAYPDLGALPKVVDAVVIEVPKEETAAWVQRAAKAGVGRVWIHQGTDTREALALAEDKGLQVHSGTCAVMYLTNGFSMHTIHKWIWKFLGKY